MTVLRHSLAGRRILVTRPRAQAASLCNKLVALGAEPIPFPTSEIAPMDDYASLDEAIGNLNQYHWIIFTSVNGVAAFWKRLMLIGEVRIPALKFAAIGPATAQALEKHSRPATFIPDEYVAEAIVAGLGNVEGQRILLPCAEIAREALAKELRHRGAIVHEIAVYRTLPATPDPWGLAELRRGVDAITFTSSSTVRNFVILLNSHPNHSDTANMHWVSRDGLPMPSLGTAVIACIGPITAQTAHDVGLPVDVIASDYTMDGLVTAICEYFSRPELWLKENRWILARSF